MTCWEAVQEVFEDASDELSTAQVIERIYARYPDRPWQRNTIYAHLIGLSVNHPSSPYYPSLRKRAFLFWEGRGRYRLYDPDNDGIWIATDAGVQRVGTSEVISRKPEPRVPALERPSPLEESYRLLASLGLQQDYLFQEALGCVQHSFFRAAHIMAWVAFMDLLQRKVRADFQKQFQEARPEWAFRNVGELQEMQIGDHDMLEACHRIGLLKRSEAGLLKGALFRRNLCGHPSAYSPTFNETLGYVDGLLGMTEQLQNRKP